MTELAAESVRAADEDVAGHEGTPDFGADRENREGGSAAAEPERSLTECKRVDVVIDDGRQLGERLDLLGDRYAMKLRHVTLGTCRRHHTLVDIHRPGQSHTDAVDRPSLRASLRIHVVDHGQQRLQRGAKTRDVGRCLDGRENLAAVAYEPAGDRRSADVDADRRDLAGDRALSHRDLSVCNSRAMRVFSSESAPSHP